jgi:hypothetical protein
MVEGTGTMDPAPAERGARVVWVLAAMTFLLEWLPGVAGPYGTFIDELYYLACAARPDWGYVDHPPLSIWLLGVVRALLGSGLWALRLVPALAAAVMVLLTGRLARGFGAGAFGQGLAALATALAPVPLIMAGFYSMNALELVLWTGLFCVVADLLRRDEPRRWLVVGLLIGVALQNKHTAVLVGAAIALGLVLSPTRRHLATRWPWLGAVVALVLIAPNLLWQAANDWPSLEFYRNADLYKNVPTPPLEALLQQVLFYNPGATPLWMGALWFFLRSARGRPYRLLGWAGASLVAAMVLSGKSRPDRIAALYPLLYAGGAAWIDGLARPTGRAWLRPASVALVALLGLPFLPVAVPILGPETTARYASALRVVPQIEAGAGKVTQLPQWFADRFGWEAFVADVEKAAEALGAEERTQAVILVPSYGHLGALELLGSPDLPPAISTHNTCYLWGRDLLADRDVQGGLVVGWSAADLEPYYELVEPLGVHRCTHCMPWRSELSIHLVWGPRVPLAERWPELRHFE